MIGWRVVADWGTTRLRLWHLNDGGIVGRRQGPGIGELAETPAQALRAALAPRLAEHGLPGADHAVCAHLLVTPNPAPAVIARGVAHGMEVMPGSSGRSVHLRRVPAVSNCSRRSRWGRAISRQTARFLFRPGDSAATVADRARAVRDANG